MFDIFNDIKDIVNYYSGTINIVLTLLLLFQWHKMHAKEQSIKFSLFAIRRILGRRNPTAEDIIEQLDAVLATLDARRPFVQRTNEVFNTIRTRFDIESQKELKNLPNEDNKSI